jgi:hypothetical protein
MTLRACTNSKKMAFCIEDLREQIPFYLTSPTDQADFINALEALISGASKGYFINDQFDPYKSELLQGDAWKGFQLFSFSRGTRSSVKGVVLSNSCDISLDNKRSVPPKVVFAPIIKLAGIEKRFVDAKLEDVQVKAKLDAIRKQSVTSLFYLPHDGALDCEYVVLLDDVHSMPIDAFAGEAETEKLFTLSMAGFWLFLFKLSLHFCRLKENVARTI